MKNVNPKVTVTIYGWDFCITNNGSVLSKNDALGKPWEERRGKEIDITDSHLGAIRNLIMNVNGIFPEKQPIAAKAEPPKEVVRPSAMQAV